MKKTLILSAILAGLVAAELNAQSPYSTSWSKINSSKHENTAGSYSHQGVMGNLISTTLQSSHYIITPDLKGTVQVISSPGVPQLAIQRIGPFIRIFWPRTESEYSLVESSNSDGTVPWNPVENIHEEIDDQIVVFLPIQPEKRFFRLQLLQSNTP